MKKFLIKHIPDLIYLVAIGNFIFTLYKINLLFEAGDVHQALLVGVCFMCFIGTMIFGELVAILEKLRERRDEEEEIYREK